MEPWSSSASGCGPCCDRECCCCILHERSCLSIKVWEERRDRTENLRHVLQCDLRLRYPNDSLHFLTFRENQKPWTWNPRWKWKSGLCWNWDKVYEFWTASAFLWAPCQRVFEQRIMAHLRHYYNLSLLLKYVNWVPWSFHLKALQAYRFDYGRRMIVMTDISDIPWSKAHWEVWGAEWGPNTYFKLQHVHNQSKSSTASFEQASTRASVTLDATTVSILQSVLARWYYCFHQWGN